MKHLFFCSFILFLSFCLHAQTPIDTSLEKEKYLGTWFMFHISKPALLAEFPDKKAEIEAIFEARVDKGILLSFHSDFTFTEIHGEGLYIHGPWKFGSVSDHLVLQDSLPGDTVKVIAFEQQFDQIVMTMENKTGEISKWVRLYTHKDLTQDPYWFSLNTWRKKPKQSETETEVKVRLKTYITHLIHLIESSRQRGDRQALLSFSTGLLSISEDKM